MPLPVADQYFLALERLGTRWAMLEESGPDEWELLSGCHGLFDFLAPL